MNFEQERAVKVAEIEAILGKYLPVSQGYQKEIAEAMEYSLMAGGKRLRPMLMKETYVLFGGASELIEPFMAAIEMIHTYSLVHDDLPAMDDDDYRRGRKATHIVYGEAMGILTGDALLNYAFETAAGAFALMPGSSLVIGRALAVLARKSGINGMIGGQVVDVSYAGKPINQEVLDFIYALKTGALIEGSMMVGAILAGASDQDITVVEKIASNVGLAFQIQDDILDITGTAEMLGKPVKSDEKNDKPTYAAVKGIEAAGREVETLSGEALRLLLELPGDHGYLAWLFRELIHRES